MVFATLGAGFLACHAQELYHLDPTASAIEIRVDTAGALGFLGHQHLIQTPIERGDFVYYPADPSRSSLELVVDASNLQVTDPEVSDKDRKEIQATMQSERVLGVKRYPKIVFKSVKVEPLGSKGLRITGNLTVRDQTHPVIVEARLEQTGPQFRAIGQSQFKQTMFGIRPVTAGLGSVRVRDRVNLSFQVFGHGQPPSLRVPASPSG